MDNGLAKRLEALALERIPGCQSLVSAERLSGGASQETYRLLVATDQGERLLALRRAAGGAEAEDAPDRPGLAVEAQLMQCAKAAGVPEPEVYHILEASDGLGDGFLMEWIEGEALGARILRSPEFAEVRPRLAYDCGRIAAQIHGMDLQATGLGAKLWRMTPAEFVEQTWERYCLLETPQPMIDYTAGWLRAHLPKDCKMALVHNDFRSGNFILNRQGVAAVLDWETAHIGDPMRDLGWICTNSWRFGGAGPVGGFGEREDLFRGYQEVSGRPVDPAHVRFWEVFGSFWWAVGCLGMGEHYRSGPDQTVERPAIGRRSSECQVDCVNLLIPGPVEAPAETPAFTTRDLPRLDELLASVRDFLRGDVMDATHGRSNFLARVAANALDMALRELALGPAVLQAEAARLRELFAADAGASAGASASASLADLRWRLVHALRRGDLPLDDPALQAHLRQTVVDQVAIDQPKYSGYRTALAAADVKPGKTGKTGEPGKTAMTGKPVKPAKSAKPAKTKRSLS